MNNRVVCVVFAGLALTPLSNAGEISLNDGMDAFLERKAQIVLELEWGDRYSEISDSDRASATAALERIVNELANVKSLDELDDERRRMIEADQRTADTVLRQAAKDSRVTCNRESAIGTHTRQSVCMSEAERERRRTESFRRSNFRNNR